MEKVIKFKGTVVRDIYNTPDFKIYALEIDQTKYPDVKRSKYGTVTISGELSDLSYDTEYEIEGIEQASAKFGYGYKVINIRRDAPKSEEEMYLFLEEILTENQARELYKHYPDIVQRVKENRLDDIDLDKLHGIKVYTFNVIKNKIIENFCLADLVIEFKGYFNLSILKKIYNKYTSVDKIKAELNSNPYKCLCALAGIGFKKADAMLLEMEAISQNQIKKGEKPIIEFKEDLKTSAQRCLSCIIYLLEENENNGHTKMNLADLRSECIKLVSACAHNFTEAVKDKAIYYNKETLDVALRKTFNLENKIAKIILRNVNNPCALDIDTEKYRNINGVELSDEQMQAVKNLCKYKISILNGAGGTGKSFSTQAIINMLKDNHMTFRLFSPTGKAAKVLADYTGVTATTIHRGLGYMPPNKWSYNKDEKLACDVLIIDEFSMVDIFLFSKVLDALDFDNTRLVLIGDNAQLPSVSCGNLLHDFMQTNIIPTTTLNKVFRYGEGGLMKVATDVRFCKKYLDSSMQRKMTMFGDNKDYAFVDLASEVIPDNAIELYKKLLTMGYGINDIQVLTAKNVGDCGTVALNNMIQKVANPNYGSVKCFKTKEVTYYEGDLVIQKVNNYKAEIVKDKLDDIFNTDDFDNMDLDKVLNKKQTAFVANGETGIVKEIFDSYMIIDFDGICVKYERPDVNNIGLGYSITIHKSQGSSIKIVILCTPQSHIFMLNSNLIYVGLTRMKEKCYHLGTLSSVNTATVKKANLTRHTFMQDLLLNMPEEEYMKTDSETEKEQNDDKQ